MRRFLLIGSRVELLIALGKLEPGTQTSVSDEPPRLDDIRRVGRVDIKMELPPERKKSVRERFGRPPRNLGKGSRNYKNTGKFLK